MSKIITVLLRNNYAFNNFNSSAVTKLYLPSTTTVRNLYAQTTLGIDGYVQTREKTKSQFSSMLDKFRSKMSEYITKDDQKNMIFTEDLKNMLHLAEANEEDMTLVVEMMKKFNQQNKELRFGSFIFGPVVMRMFYFLNKPNKALECFKSEELTGFFDQLMSYQILLDMLYENSRYDDLLQTFEIIKEKQIKGSKYPKNVVVLVMAACYKQNTPQSLNYALELWKELNDIGHLPMRRAATFCAGLALNQGKPQIAIEIVSCLRNPNYFTIRNIKAAALSDLRRYEDVIPILRSVLEIDDPENKKHNFTKDVVQRVHDSFQKCDVPDILKEYQRIEKLLKENGHVSDELLSNQLCTEIEKPQFIQSNERNQNFQPRRRVAYDGQRRNNIKPFQQRPGLKDMY